MESIWNGFKKIEFDYEGRKAILVYPNTPTKENKWLYKTEYFGAFPDFEIEMLKKGYYIANLENKSRWCPEEDTEMRSRFCEYLIQEYGLNEKCMIVGMSCGGMQGVYFTAQYPKYVAALYLDAPVLNYLSCPYALGEATTNFIEEFEVNMGITLSELLNFRKHPIDFKEKLLKTNVPIFLIAGDSDKTVPFNENGKVLLDYFKANGGNITAIVKENCDHHPHGLTDNTPLIKFAEEYY